MTRREFVVASAAWTGAAQTPPPSNRLNLILICVDTWGAHYVGAYGNPWIKTPHVDHIEMELEALEKGGYEHFMLKEIMEQPKSIADSIRGRLQLENMEVKLGGLSTT